MFQRNYAPFLVFLLFLLGFGPSLSAQNTVSVTGKVLSYDQNSALEYVSVKLFKLPDSTFQKGVFTNADGRFSLNTNPGKY
jgi:hypothetical protein